MPPSNRISTTRHTGARPPTRYNVRKFTAATYARAVAACNTRARAREEFDVLVDYYPGLEARARYATLLHEWGETERAQALAADSLRDARRLPAHTREQERQWLAQLQKADRTG